MITHEFPNTDVKYIYADDKSFYSLSYGADINTVPRQVGWSGLSWITTDKVERMNKMSYFHDDLFTVDLKNSKLYMGSSEISDGKFTGQKLSDEEVGKYRSRLRFNPHLFQPHLLPGCFRTKNFVVCKLPLTTKGTKLFLPLSIIEAGASGTGVLVCKVGTDLHHIINAKGAKAVAMTLDETMIAVASTKKSGGQRGDRLDKITIYDNPLQ